MNLILWRHADAEDGRDDMARRLTRKGRNQAKHVAEWLERHLPASTRVIVSPAVRARQTAEALARDLHTDEHVSPGAAPADVLAATGWPNAPTAVLVVGHQPTLGEAAALALTGKPLPWHVPKGGLWWLRSKDDGEVVVVAVMTPALV
ncbi:MAG TPA: histidine phosphatase family protein [Burkholderiales bacterium]|nr:histidine phosphatase family protein [Burkholderiales bacterium]